MSRKRKALLSFLTPFVLLLFITVVNPLRWPQTLLESYVLSITPNGSSYAEVLSEVEKRPWEIANTSKEHGFYDQRAGEGKETGSMSIRASLGEYQGFPFSTNVTVFWGFDSSGALIDIWVWTTRNGI